MSFRSNEFSIFSNSFLNQLMFQLTPRVKKMLPIDPTINKKPIFTYKYQVLKIILLKPVFT